MERSKGYYRRKELLKTLTVPTMSEVKETLGEALANVVFGECPEALKSYLGLEPKLKGPGTNLWISPSDVLIGKVCLKPPLTDKHIKALTHEGIIVIGQDIEQKFWNEMEMEKETALRDHEDYLRHIAEAEKRVAVKMARDEEIVKCNLCVEELRREFEERLAHELDHLSKELLEQQEEMIKTASRNVEKEWRLKLEEAVDATVERLTKQFLNDLEKQKTELEAVFRLEFEKQNNHLIYAMKHEQDSCQTTMNQLRHCLECKNIANLVYILCMERRKCCIERSVLEYTQKTKNEELSKAIEERDEIIKVITEERDKKQKQLDVREKCVLEILKQFQKFINYALRATPTQAEFLLDVRKMMLFEITQAMVELRKNTAQHLAREILPWRSDSETTSETQVPRSRLTLNDYHDCLDETVVPGDPSDFLPAFYYNNKLYVNEDLRVMVAKGMSLSQTNIMWNKDAENLIQVLKASVKDDSQEIKREPSTSSISSHEMEEKDSHGKELRLKETERQKFDELKSIKLKRSNVSISAVSRKSVLKSSGERINPQLLYCSISGMKDGASSVSKDTIKKILISGGIDAEIAPLDTTGLLAARDSLVKIREFKKSSHEEMPSIDVHEVETGNMLMALRESLEMKPNIDVKSLPEGSVNFENLDAIRIPDQLEIKKTSRSSKIIDMINYHKVTASAIGQLISSKGKSSTKVSIIKASKPGLPRESILMSSPKKNVSRESRLLSAVDSLIIHRNSIVSNSLSRKCTSTIVNDQQGNSRRASVVSRLSVARDSLELIRKHSALSKSKVTSTSADELVVKASPISNTPNEYQSISRKISPLTTSHIEIAKIPTVIPDT